jgi:hypothetical protein
MDKGFDPWLLRLTTQYVYEYGLKVFAVFVSMLPINNCGPTLEA